MAETEVLIRPAGEEDLLAVSRLEAENFSHPWTYDDFAGAFANKDYLYYVAEADGGVRAVAGLLKSFDEAEVLNVSVDKNYRKRRIAKKLLLKLMEEGRLQGIRDFALDVRSGNTAAIALYEGLGFVKEGTRRDFYRDPKEDAYVYRLRG